MYSPIIKTDLIPIIYRLGQSKKQSMTKIVDTILRKALIVKENKPGWKQISNQRRK